MAKIALLLLGGCILLGSLKLVALENQPDTEEKDAAPSEDQEHAERVGLHVFDNQKIEEKAGASASAVARPRPFPPSPSPIINLVECYVCTDCPKVTSNTPSKLCPYSIDPRKKNQCVVYAEQYKHMKKPWYIRGCATERGSCADIRKAHASHADIVSLMFCSECKGDKCNTNSASSLSDFTMAFFAMVVTPLVAKYTLS